MSEFLGVNASYLAFQRLNYIKTDMNRLVPEVQLLNPQEGSRRLEPLENEVSEQQRLGKSLNIEYKVSIMNDLKTEAEKLQERGQSAVDDMGKVGNEIAQVTNDMREIVDGLGSGVTPEQLEASVDLGKQWLEEIKQYNFDEERQLSITKQNAARDLRDKTNGFAEPVATFQDRVSGVEESIESVGERLQDLEDNSEKASEMVS
jgi:methyl-accepting chemotaxis protein